MTLVFLFILGTLVGSFLNVCIFRLPRDKSIIAPRSACPHCHTALNALDLIPILSYLFLRGRCRYCHHSISWRYPLIEFLTGVIYVGLFLFFGLGFDFVFYVILFSILEAILFIDLDFQVIPDILTYVGIGLGLIYNLFRGQIFSAVIGALAGFIFMFLLRKIATYFYKQEAMGEGDVLLSALMGAVLGWQNLILALFLTYLLGALAGIILILSKRKGLRSEIPFGPLLVLGTVLTVLFGNQLWQIYLLLICNPG